MLILLSVVWWTFFLSSLNWINSSSNTPCCLLIAFHTCRTLLHSFETRPGHRPGQVIGSRVRWVDPGQPKKKQLLCSWCLITRIIGGSKFAIVTGCPSCPVRHSFLNQSMSDYYRISMRHYPSCYRSWEEYIYIYIYIYIYQPSNWHRRCASILLFLLSYTTPTSQPIDFKDLLIFYLISNIFFKNNLTLKNYCKHTTSSITTA